jgi:hypothetical protein
MGTPASFIVIYVFTTDKKHFNEIILKGFSPWKSYASLV